MKLLTKDGRISRYGFACGYVETFQNGEFSARLSMPLASSGVFLVTENNDPWRVAYNGRNLTKARKAFDSAKKASKQ